MFKNNYNDNIAELDLVIAPVYFNQERYEDFKNILDKVSTYLADKKNVDILKSKSLYLYSAYFRKKKDYDLAEQKLNEALTIFNNATGKNKNGKELQLLKGKILFHKSNLIYAKNSPKNFEDRDLSDIKASLQIIKEAFDIFDVNGDVRDQLRSVELYGRLCVLLNDGNLAITELNKYKKLVHDKADERTKMLFYLTYSDAYRIIQDYDTSLTYCQSAKNLAQKLNLSNEIMNISKKIETIIAAKKT